MKILNSNFQKVAKDSKDRFELLQKEFTAFDTAVRNQIQDVKHKVDIDLKNIEERTLLVIDKYFNKINIDGKDNKISGTNGMSIFDMDDRLKTLKEELKLNMKKLIIQATDK